MVIFQEIYSTNVTRRGLSFREMHSFETRGITVRQLKTEFNTFRLITQGSVRDLRIIIIANKLKFKQSIKKLLNIILKIVPK